MTNSNSNSNSNSDRARKEEEIQVLTSIKSEYNDIKIVETKIARILYLENSGRVHSILYKSPQKWTNSYWDEFTTLPAILPPGPVAVFGLGGGTVAHQLLHSYPSLSVHGWEIDQLLVEKSRQFLGMSDLEMPNDSRKGMLRVCVGDALSPAASVEGNFAGIVVDLFSGITMLPALEKPETWLEMGKKLRPDGRIMVNCGRGSRDCGDVWEDNRVVQAMCDAFGKKSVNWKKMSKIAAGRNYIAFTGSLPDIGLWSDAVPEKLRPEVELWRSCDS